MPPVRNSLEEILNRKIAAAKAAKGYSWDDLAEIMTGCGIAMSASNLMTRSSRGAFKATELVVLMRALGITAIDLSDVDIPGIATAIALVEKKHQQNGK